MARRKSADELRVAQKVVPDHFFAAPRQYVRRNDYDQLDYAPIGTGVKNGQNIQIASPRAPRVVSRACFLAKSRARSFLGARDSIEVGRNRAWPVVRYRVYPISGPLAGRHAPNEP